MTQFVVAVAVPIPPTAPFSADAFPHLAAAVQTLAAAGMEQWVRYAKGATLPDGSSIGSRSGAYANGIQIEQTGPFAWRIFNEVPYAQAIETGAPARDLKKMLDTSFKVRVGKSGRRYLIIPLRWGTPGTVTFGRNVMPESVHEFWQQQTVVRSHHVTPARPTRTSQTGAVDVQTRHPVIVPNYQYQWGTRLTQANLHKMGIGTDFNGKRYLTHPMAGMVNMRNPAVGMFRPRSKHSSYLTFRVMQEGSPGWLAPAQPGKYPAKAVADQLEKIAEKAFAAAVEQDLRIKLTG